MKRTLMFGLALLALTQTASAQVAPAPGNTLQSLDEICPGYPIAVAKSSQAGKAFNDASQAVIEHQPGASFSTVCERALVSRSAAVDVETALRECLNRDNAEALAPAMMIARGLQAQADKARSIAGCDKPPQ